MVNKPPRTGDLALDRFLNDIYEFSAYIDTVTMPENGWSLSDFTAEVSEIIGDKRDLIDIVESYSDIQEYEGVIVEQQKYLNGIAGELREVAKHSERFTQVMEWWDQNYREIASAAEAMEQANVAKGFAEAAAADAIEAEKSRTAAEQAQESAQNSAVAAASEREFTEAEADAAEVSRLASEAAQELAETAQGLAEQFRDTAKEHSERAQLAETNAEDSASTASAEASSASGFSSTAETEAAKVEAVKVEVKEVETSLRNLMEETEVWQDVSFALESVDSRITTGIDSVLADIAEMGGAVGGASIIPNTKLDSGDNIQAWAKNMDVVKDDSIPTGRAYASGPGSGYQSNPDNQFFEVDPGLDYYASMWVKADKPDSKTYFEMRDQDNSHAIKSGNLHDSATYLLGNYDMPTEWTHLETRVLRFNEDVHRVKLGQVYLNHGNGTERNAVQMFTDIQLIPIPKHDHTIDNIIDLPEISTEVTGSSLVQRDPSGQIPIPLEPAEDGSATSRKFVLEQVETRVTPAEVDSRIEAIIGSAPEHLDTLGELADKLTDQDSTSAVLTEQISGKSDIGHEHTMEEITDLPDMSTEVTSGVVVRRLGTGDIKVPRNPSSQLYAVSKGHVDDRIATRSEVGHKHTAEEITDLPTVSADTVGSSLVQRHSDGHITVPNNPISAGDAGSKHYIDQRVDTRSEVGHKHTMLDITDLPSVSSSSEASAIVQRLPNSQIPVPNNPASGSHATSRNYVDGRTPEIKFVSAGSAPSKAPSGQLIMEYE